MKQQKNNVDEKQVRLLERRLAAAEAESKRYQEDFKKLQEEFILMQDGRESINSALIRKYQLRAENAETELKKMYTHFTEENKLKDDRIRNLECRLDEVQAKLIENHNDLENKQAALERAQHEIETVKRESSERCQKAELKVLNSKRNEDKLYHDIHQQELAMQELEEKVANAKQEQNLAQRDAAKLKSEMSQLKSQLTVLISSMNGYLSDNTTEAETSSHLPDSHSDCIESTKAIADKPIQQLEKNSKTTKKESGIIYALVEKAKGWFL